MNTTQKVSFSFSKLRYGPFELNPENFANIGQIKWKWIRLMKSGTVRIYFLSEFAVCCHRNILLPWQRDVTTSPLYCTSVTLTSFARHNIGKKKCSSSCCSCPMSSLSPVQLIRMCLLTLRKIFCPAFIDTVKDQDSRLRLFWTERERSCSTPMQQTMEAVHYLHNC